MTTLTPARAGITYLDVALIWGLGLPFPLFLQDLWPGALGFVEKSWGILKKWGVVRHYLKVWLGKKSWHRFLAASWYLR